jgi:hemerythrin-like domain-containing protein
MAGAGSDEKRNLTAVQRWWEEHSELDRLVKGLEDTLEVGNAARASEALERFAEALGSHLSVEEDVYFPLLEQLLPESLPDVRQARVAHRDLLSELDRMRDQLADTDVHTARSTLERLLWRFRDHEKLEAELIAQVRARA